MTEEAISGRSDDACIIFRQRSGSTVTEYPSHSSEAAISVTFSLSINDRDAHAQTVAFFVWIMNSSLILLLIMQIYK